MKHNLNLALPAGLVAAAAGVAGFLSVIAVEPYYSVGTNRWIIWLGASALALAATTAVALAATILRWLRARPAAKGGPRPPSHSVWTEVLLVVVPALVLATAWAGSETTPAVMAGPLGRRVAGDKRLKATLQRPLAQRRYTIADARAELVRLSDLGRAWQAAFFGDPGKGGSADVANEPVVPLLQRFGFTAYGGLLEEQLQLRSWSTSPPAPQPWRFNVQTEDEKKDLQLLIDDVRALGSSLREAQKNTQPARVEWVGRFVDSYADQADQLAVGLGKPEESNTPEIGAWEDAVDGLDRSLTDLRTLRLADASVGPDEVRKRWEEYRSTALKAQLPVWGDLPDVAEDAVKAVRNPAEAERVRRCAERLTGLVEAYAKLAKQAKLWEADPNAKPAEKGLKDSYQALADKDSLKRIPPRFKLDEYKPMTQALAALREALLNQTGDSSPAPSGPFALPAAGAWRPEEVLRLVETRLGMADWDDPEITVDGTKMKLLAAIHQRWTQDFLVPPPVVSPDKFSEDEAVGHANRTVVFFVKLYAAQQADEWQKRIDKVNEAKRVLGAPPMDFYPPDVRRPIRAHFTEDGYWGRDDAHRAHLKEVLQSIPFPAKFVDVVNSDVGNRNPAVEENRIMAEEFVKALRAAAKMDADIDAPSLAVGDGWFTVFMAGDGGDKSPVDPFGILIRIRNGLPSDKPRDESGKVIQTPDGRIDYSKAGGRPVGAVRELGGPAFHARLNAPEPLPAAETKPGGTAAPPTPTDTSTGKSRE